MWFIKNSYKREVYSNSISLQETSQINNPALHLKHPEKDEQTKPKVSRRNHNDQSRKKQK